MLAKVLKDIEKAISTEDLLTHLKSFDLKSFEDQLFDLVLKFYRDLCESILKMFCNSDDFKSQCKAKAREMGGKKLKLRKVSLRICTGAKVCFDSLYISKVKDVSIGERQLFHRLFDTVGGNSVAYTSRVCAQSVIAPSFETGTELLKEVGVSSTVSTNRRHCLNFGHQNLKRRVALQLEQGESLKGKVVLIAVDGGRSRTRSYNGEVNANGEREYDTPWKEPKLFVIHTIDPKTGKQSQKELPIYDCCFGDDECFELLEAYLGSLKVEQAGHIQFVADGAPWIWNRALASLKKLKVKEANITQTLDYYHAVQHLGALLEALPKSVGAAQKVGLRTKCKELLWNGDVKKMIGLIKKQADSQNQDMDREIKYFEKHEKRCSYKVFRERKLVCGSGIIESGIRRVINLRFKAPASFWDRENLQPLIYLRAVFLSKRWNNIWKNRLKLNGGQI